MSIQVSVIATVLNEAKTIEKWLETLAQQTRLPDEIVIVDGGSQDATPQLIEAWSNQLPIKLVIQSGVNISEGRNLAIAQAQHEIIASTDAGTRLHPEWLAQLTQPFIDNPETVNVAGFFLADYDSKNPFEVAMSAAVLPALEDINPQHFLPSSRSVAFRKSAWAEIGGYPEWLDYCEDLIFDIRLKEITGDFVFAPQAIAYFRPRTTLKSYFIQYYRYSRGDGKADLWRKRHAIRYITYLVLAPLILLLGLFVHPALWLLYGVGALGYFYRLYQRLFDLWDELSLAQKIKALGWVAVIRVVGDIAKMLAYPVGWRWRLQNKPPDWQV